MTTNRSVTATFTLPSYTLTATKTGTGSGTMADVYSGGLSCSGNTCTGVYSSGYRALISPTADPGSTFTGWTGCEVVIGNTCYVTMTTNKSMTATFTLGGPLDTAFNPDTEGEVHAIALQGDGKILIGGYFYSIRGALRRSVARLNPDGTLDIYWKPNLENWDDEQSVRSIAIQQDDKAIIGGYFFGIDGLLRTSIARLNTDGSLDMDFEPDVGGYTYDELGSVMSIALQPDGKIIMGGYFGSINGVTRRGIGRLNSDSTLDMDFNPNASNEAYIYALALQPDGKILVGGDFTTMNGTARNGLARLNANGTLDTVFAPVLSTGAEINALALQPDGKILVGGGFTTVNGVTRNRFARLNSDGTLDTGFNVNLERSYHDWNDGGKSTGPASPSSIFFQPDGNILMGGNFTTVNGVTRNGLARLYSDGSLDPDFNPNVTTSYGSGEVYSIALQPDGNILIGGYFTAVGGVPRYSFARIIDTDVPPADTYTLSTIKSGTGSGTITSNPSGISCGSDCSETYASGTPITLTATAAAGSTFGGWTGCGSVNGNTCTVTMTNNITVTAYFTDVPNDFNNDGNPDILWRNTATGDNVIWLMNGTNWLNSVWLGSVSDTTWAIVGVGDFNHDSNPDILWRNTATGDNVIWLMNGTNWLNSVWLGSVADVTWSIVGVGDFNNDTNPDILWRNTVTGDNVIWLMNGTNWLNSVWLGSVSDTTWAIVGVGDFNNDTNPDILWRNTVTGDNVIWLMNGTNWLNSVWLGSVSDTTWAIVGVGDFNHDSNPDILWRNTVTGDNVIWLMNETNWTESVWLPAVTDVTWHIVGK
jgi:uncharacterized delta-60 repeat protein